MSNTIPARPTFTSGQYIGADDLNEVVAYARDETQRLALSARTWGIATGLALVEVPDSSGNIQMFIEPGIAWDGYGRPVVVLSPAQVTLALFANLPTGDTPVWLYYSATATQAIAPGFQTCGSGDPTTRVQETYAIAVGPMTDAQLTGGIVIGGGTVANPADMLTAVDQHAATVLDESAAQQSFPGDSTVWLIPVGIASYNAGSPGTFSARNPNELLQNRVQRVYMGLAAEGLLASDGVLRLRDRQTDNIANLSDDQLAAAAAIQLTDVSADPNNSTRVIGNELVWVEGNLRVTGNARLFGTQLELFNSKGFDGGVPEFMRRGTSVGNTNGGQDLQICIGSQSGTAGQDRLTVGVLTVPDAPLTSTSPDGAISEVMVVRTDAKVAIGTNAIDSYSTLANSLVVATTADTGITIVSGKTKTGNLFFATPTTQQDGYVSYDHGKQQLELGADSTTSLVVTADQVVIGPADPSEFTGSTDQLVVASDSGVAGIMISAKAAKTATLDFASAGTRAGAVTYDLGADRMDFATATAPQVSIDKLGQIWTGTVAGPLSLVLDDTSIQAVSIALPTVTPGPLQLQPLGSNVGIATATPQATLHVHAPTGTPGLIVDTTSAGTALWAGYLAQGGAVAVGAPGPARTTLDVRAAIAAPSNPDGAEGSHVAYVENTSTSAANVLALKLDTTAPINGSNFVTFYDAANNAVGAIEASTFLGFNTCTFVSLFAADYAEAVPRAPGIAPIGAGRIVGVRNGQVSLTTDGADAVFVTTGRPAVLGNAPPRSQRDGYEMLAFLGQLRILIAGPVESGDLILPSGQADGKGRAVKLADVQPSDLPLIVGRAWESSADATSTGVNALVGPGVATAAAMASLLARQAAELERHAKPSARRKSDAT